jgi:NodT family efflux transporter outer membrane factor (OMF) lipoprotein
MNPHKTVKRKPNAWRIRTPNLVRVAAFFGTLPGILFLSGCVAPTRVAKPAITPPPSWNSAGAEAGQSPSGDLSEWWKQFGDHDLSDLIGRALKNNTSLRSARARLREARAQRNLAAANLRPSLTASPSSTGEKSSPANASTNVFSAALDASWEPDVFGSGHSSLRAATADLATSVGDLENTQVSLVAEVASDYVALRSYQARLEIENRNEASQSQTLQLTQWRAQAGLVSSIDVEQARSNLEQTRASIPSLETSAAESEHRLSILLGLNPGALQQQLAATAPIPSVPDTVAVGIPADTLRQRPDVRAAEQKIVAETARLRVQEAARYPSFSLSGSFGIEQLLTGTSSAGVTAGSTVAALAGATTILASATGSITQTLFDGGRIRSQIESQNAVQEQAVVSYEATVLTALEDVENALVSLRKNRERLAALNQAAESARNAAVLAQNRYTAGLIDFQTVLDTERTALTIEDSVAQTQADRTTALIQLYKALGGGWSPATVTVSSSGTQGNRS